MYNSCIMFDHLNELKNLFIYNSICTIRIGSKSNAYGKCQLLKCFHGITQLNFTHRNDFMTALNMYIDDTK